MSKISLEVKTQRLIIRPLEASDYEVWKSAYSEMRPVQNRWDETNWHAAYLTRAAFRKNLSVQKKKRDRDQDYYFHIFRKDDGALIGHVSLMDISRGLFQNAYLGYRVYNSYWGYGYAKEAVSALTKFSFRHLGLHRLEAGIEPDNKASIALAKSVGMRKESLSSRRLLYRGKWIDLILYAITCEDLRIRYKAPPPVLIAGRK